MGADVDGNTTVPETAPSRAQRLETGNGTRLRMMAGSEAERDCDQESSHSPFPGANPQRHSLWSLLVNTLYMFNLMYSVCVCVYVPWLPCRS